jgi:ABC-2 type transport system permease protein
MSMSTTSHHTSAQEAAAAYRPAMGWLMHDTIAVARRHVLKTTRVPETLFFALVQPVIFVVLFAFVFGGSINVGEGGAQVYREFLIPGIFAQTVAFAIAGITVGIAEDAQKGIMDRFRSLPMRPAAVLSGHTAAALVQNALVLVMLTITGLIVGWRIRGSVVDAIAAYALLLLFAYALTWLGALVGLSVPDPQVAGTAGLVWIFPLTFVSSAFTPTANMPDWLATFAVWNPVSCLALAVRELFGNPTPFVGDTFPEQNAILMATLWGFALLAVFAPLAVRKYRRSVA